MNRICKESKAEQGSATVEAIIAFVVFLFTIVTILSMVHLCRAQMLISTAVDTAAKEMASYAYFYKMSGLQKFDKDISGKAAVGKGNINAVIGTVDTLYSTLGNAKEQTVEDLNALADATSTLDLDAAVQGVDNAIVDLKNNTSDIMTGFHGVVNAIEGVGDNPLLYMRSLVAIAGEEGMDWAKRAIAVPLAKHFVRKNFEVASMDPDVVLKQLGVTEGFDSINFNLSTMFTDADKEEIQIVALYKVRLLSFIDWSVLEATVTKQAVCKAWLGGDDVQVYVDPTIAAAPEQSEETPQKSEETNTTDETDETDKTDETDVNPEQPKNSSTGSWALQHDPKGYYHSKRYESFEKILIDENRLDDAAGYTYFMDDEDSATVAYSFDVYAKHTYNADEVFANKIEGALQEIQNDRIRRIDQSVQQFSDYTLMIYVPENMPDDQFNEFEADAKNALKKIEEYKATDETGKIKDMSVKIVIRRAGGQYDYSSSEEDYVHIGEEK